MKFLKKIGAILLAVAMLPAISTFAEVSQSYGDNLNTYQADATMPWSGYGNATYPSDVFIKNSGNYGFIDADGGPDGTAALQMTQTLSSNGNVALKTRTIDTGTATNPVIAFTYDFKVVSHPETADMNIYLGSNISVNQNLFKLTQEDEVWKIIDCNGVDTAYAYTLNKWYKMEVVSSTDGMRGKIIDYDTGEIAIESVNSSAGLQKAFQAAYFQGAVAGTTSFCSVMFDNVKLTMYDAAVNAPALVCANVTNGGEDVPRNQKLTFVFDQEVDGNSVITLAKEDGTPLAGITNVKTVKTLYNTLTVTYDGLLEKGKEYVLSFENVTNGTTACADESISFTTENLHLWNNVLVSSAEPNEIDATKTDVTFTIGEEYGYPTFSGSVMAVVYQGGKMIDVDIKPLSNVSTGELTESFGLGTVPADAKIGIILLDVENGPIPLAGGMFGN